VRRLRQVLGCKARHARTREGHGKSMMYATAVHGALPVGVALHAVCIALHGMRDCVGARITTYPYPFRVRG